MSAAEKTLDEELIALQAKGPFPEHVLCVICEDFRPGRDIVLVRYTQAWYPVCRKCAALLEQKRST